MYGLFIFTPYVHIRTGENVQDAAAESEGAEVCSRRSLRQIVASWASSSSLRIHHQQQHPPPFIIVVLRLRSIPIQHAAARSFIVR